MKTDEELSNEFFENGVIIIPSVYELKYIQKLNDKFHSFFLDKIYRQNYFKPIEDILALIKNKERLTVKFEPIGGNHDINRWNMHLPSTEDFISNELLGNERIISIIKKIVGENVVCTLIASDTAAPFSAIQRTHQDFFEFGITLNIPLVNVTSQNAPIEYWPKSHRKIRTNEHAPFSFDNIQHTEAELFKIKKDEPCKSTLEIGSVLIRDHRLVHRGTINLSESHRHFISIWFKRPPQPEFFPSKRMTNLCSILSRKLRRHYEKKQQSEKINLANYIGREIDRRAYTDRNIFRKIPIDIWNSLSKDVRHMLRTSEVENCSTKHETKLNKTIEVLIFLTKNLTKFLIIPFIV